MKTAVKKAIAESTRFAKIQLQCLLLRFARPWLACWRWLRPNPERSAQSRIVGLAPWWHERHAQLRLIKFEQSMAKLDDRGKTDVLCIIAFLAFRGWIRGKPKAFETLRQMHTPESWVPMIARGAWLYAIGPA